MNTMQRKESLGPFLKAEYVVHSKIKPSASLAAKEIDILMFKINEIFLYTVIFILILYKYT